MKTSIFALLISLMLSGCSRMVEQTSKVSRIPEPPLSEVHSNSNYSWIVEPKLEYDVICFDPFAQNYQGIFVGSDTELACVISPIDGEKINESIVGDSVGFTTMYDRERGVWGIRTYATWGQKRYNEGNVEIFSSYKDLKYKMNLLQEINANIVLVKNFNSVLRRRLPGCYVYYYRRSLEHFSLFALLPLSPPPFPLLLFSSVLRGKPLAVCLFQKITGS